MIELKIYGVRPKEKEENGDVTFMLTEAWHLLGQAKA